MPEPSAEVLLHWQARLLRNLPLLTDEGDKLFRYVIEAGKHLTGFGAGSVMLYDEFSQALRIERPAHAANLLESDLALTFFPYDPDRMGLAGQCFRTRELQFNEDLEEKRGYFLPCQRTPIRSIICSPLLVARECVGVLSLHDAQARSLGKNVLASVAALSSAAAAAIARALADRIDTFTGLLRRDRLAADVRSLVRTTEYPLVSAFFCDIKHFRSMQERLSFEESERTLVLVAQSLKSWALANFRARAYYWGADEFVILAAHDQTGWTEMAAQDIRRHISEQEWNRDRFQLSLHRIEPVQTRTQDPAAVEIAGIAQQRFLQHVRSRRADVDCCS